MLGSAMAPVWTASTRDDDDYAFGVHGGNDGSARACDAAGKLPPRHLSCSSDPGLEFASRRRNAWDAHLARNLPSGHRLAPPAKRRLWTLLRVKSTPVLPMSQIKPAPPELGKKSAAQAR